MKRDWEAYAEVKQQVFARDNYKCRHCGWSEVTPHHILFRSRGGQDTVANVVSLCSACHNACHDGNLRIIGIDANVELKFIRKTGWNPKW
jgi:5-methylcytosine-specific restriction endonuclease McrA